MATTLYNPEILRLAASTANWPRLASAHVSVERRAPVCGSRIVLDLALDTGRIVALGYAVNSCALGQASAALLGQVAPGLDSAGIRAMTDQLLALLRSGGEAGMFSPIAAARDYPARHGAILLPWEAALDALAVASANGKVA